MSDTARTAEMDFGPERHHVLHQDLEVRLAALEASAAEASWPVGSVFIGAEAVDPATLLGVGTWTNVRSVPGLAGMAYWQRVA